MLCRDEEAGVEWLGGRWVVEGSLTYPGAACRCWIPTDHATALNCLTLGANLAYQEGLLE